MWSDCRFGLLVNLHAKQAHQKQLEDMAFLPCFLQTIEMVIKVTLGTLFLQSITKLTTHIASEAIALEFLRFHIKRQLDCPTFFCVGSISFHC